MLERVAGATTDIQFIIHQGMGALGAGFWVGANAPVRMPAFRQIAQPSTEDGFTFYKFVQDRTVIEDTGSTIDLRARGWRVHNHVEPLAWSATPPDFGTLTIQRRRWANGGLILLPDLFSYLRNARLGRAMFAEAFMRFHYLASQAFASLGVLALLLYPFDDRFASNLLPLTAIPYFVLYGRDLRRLCCTPKVEGRTASPTLYLAIEIALFFWMLIMFQHDVIRNDREHAFFALSSALAFAYGFIEMIGLPAMMEDLYAGASDTVRSAFGMTASTRASDVSLLRHAKVAAFSLAGFAASGATLFVAFAR